MSASDRDSLYMAAALRLAAKGRGLTSPNPLVGAVVVSGNRIVGQGYHHRAGGPHAEVIALESAGRHARDASLYVTLEPCCHTRKRTPPCVPAVIASGVRRIVIAMPDPNPEVGGRGIRALRRSGINVAVDCRREEAERLNEPYSHWIRTGRPFVILKAGMTLDGKIAPAGGESQWITGKAARQDVHRLRSWVDAIMVGIGTILRDNPRLTARVLTGAARSSGRHQPTRVILDSRLRVPLKAKVLHHSSGRTIVVTTAAASTRRIEQLRKRGIMVLVVPQDKHRVSLPACLERLGKMDITSVLLEGGSELNAAAFRAGVVNRVRLYVAPLLLGGQDAKGLIGGRSPQKIAEAIRLTDMSVTRIGPDLVMDARPR